LALIELSRIRFWHATLPRYALGSNLRTVLLAALLLTGLGVGTSEAWTLSSPEAAASWTMAPVHVLVYALALAILATGTFARSSSMSRTADDQDEALAGLSHGLRTPLNAVIGFSELMLAEVHGPLGHPKYVDYAKHVSESGTRLAEVTEQLLRAKELAAGNTGSGKAG
jgi:signal transduction histidine kinase